MLGNDLKIKYSLYEYGKTKLFWVKLSQFSAGQKGEEIYLPLLEMCLFLDTVLRSEIQGWKEH